MEPSKSQVAETATTTTNKAHKYVMPGLCPDIAYEFRKRKGVIPHARTIAMNRNIEAGAVYPALIYTLFEITTKLTERQEMLERRMESMSVRQFQGLQRVA